MRRGNFQLIGALISRDTLDAHERLAIEARDHILVGSIIIPMYKGKRYYPITTGWAAENYTFTAGVMGVCLQIIEQKAVEQSVPNIDT